MTKNAFLTADKLDVPASGRLGPSTGPISDGAISSMSRGPISDAGAETMTVGGVASATALLLVLLVGAAVFGWNAVKVSPFGGVQFPAWVMAALLGGIGLLVLSFFRPTWARFLAPGYALVQGLVIGAISHVYEFKFDGIVLQAAMLTVAIFGAMLFLYGTRIIKVTDRLRRGVMAATMGIMAVYAFQLILQVIGADMQVPFLHNSGPVGILVSLVIVGVASFNYLIDFDFVERAAAAGAPKHTEWVAALGLLVTTVWLYLELLRLLAKLRD